ncbi:hypothetical protein THASP1DRAFT_27159 [Thamnocephalis sphaerospora]|uniref:F-box domain-containing protein n=1 Tax=Thamnocephalis sphaerospora TaxID=78915 RepID=A0A4P9XZZ3_9FUNG|nr:hypothetical protein THASP1DRAFT_27159 [Thamnocephalis sphaerospora]|eukprot:RKP11060.1 hypothetical protein THASP1DRAFT_27159 [Thamnocephalis sphaerospora]
MMRLPEKVLDRIVEASDEASLAVLSCTSKHLHNYVSRQQQWWRAHFEQQFPRCDDSEHRWLCQYKQTHQASQTDSTADGSPDALDDFELNWYSVYCGRRTTEYRWRHGQHTMHQLTSAAADTHPDGIHIQSIPYVSWPFSPSDAVIASQWLPTSQQRPIWHMVQPCWEGVETEDVVIDGNWFSDEYLAIQIKDKSDSRRRSLCVWRFTSLHTPPHIVVTDQPIRYVDIHKSWLVGQYWHSYETNQCVTFVYNLDQDVRCPDTLGNYTSCCIQRATTDGLYIVRVDDDIVASGPLTVSYQLQQVLPDREEPLQSQAAGATWLNNGGSIVPQRIDDSRFILWSPYTTRPDPGSPPNMVLLEVADHAAAVSLNEKWLLRVQVEEVRPIVSRNLLAAKHSGSSMTLHRLADGSEVHRVHLDSWYLSGLYPTESQWAKMAKNTVWQVPESCRPNAADQESSPTAILYSKNGVFTVLDYGERCAA